MAFKAITVQALPGSVTNSVETDDKIEKLSEEIQVIKKANGND